MQKTLGRPLLPGPKKDLLHPPLTTFGDFPVLGNFPGPQHPNDWPRPTQGLPGPSGPSDPEDPGRVRKESGKSTPGQGPRSPERVRPRVSKESEKSLKPDFLTPFRLFWGPGPGYPFRFPGPSETLCGAGPIATLWKTHTHAPHTHTLARLDC